MDAKGKKVELVVKMPIKPSHVQISSSTSSSTQEDSHYSPPMPNPIKDSSLSLHSSSPRILESDHNYVMHNQSTTSSYPSIEYFKERNFMLNEQLQEHVRLDRHLKHENAVLKTKVASLQTLVDNMTRSN